MTQFHGSGLGRLRFAGRDAKKIALAGRVGPLPPGRSGMACDLLLSEGMQALRLVMLLAAVPVCYLLFFHSPPAGNNSSTPAAHSQYKREMDQARDAAKQMQAQKTEADAL